MDRITAGLKDHVDSQALSMLISLKTTPTSFVEVRNRTLIIECPDAVEWLAHLALSNFRWINIQFGE